MPLSGPTHGEEVPPRRFRTRMLKILRVFVERVPPAVGNIIADRLGDLGYIYAARSRRAAISNMKHVRRGAPKAVLKRDVRHIFHNIMRNYYDLCRAPGMSDEQLDQVLKFDEEGWQRVRDLHAQKRSVVMVSAHYGAFDMLTQVLSRHEPKMTVLVAQVKPAWLSDFITDMRGARGLELLMVEEEEGSGLNLGALKRSISLLRQGGVLGVLADRHMESQGVQIPFFGYETTVAAGVAKMALRTRSAVVPGFCQRLPGGHYKVTFEEPIEPVGSASNEGDIKALLTQIFSRLEYHIGRNPEQWVLLQPVWPKP